MKKVKLVMAVLALGFLSMTAACSKDNDNEGNKDNNGGNNTLEYPKTLTYDGSYEVKEFKMYVGSPNGAVEINTTGMKPETLWKAEIESIKESYDFSVTFLNDSVVDLFAGEKKMAYSYKFEDGRLYITSAEHSMAMWSGDMSKLTAICGILKVPIVNGERFDGRFIDLDLAVGAAYKKSLAELTNPSDTIAWCNMEFVWK